MRRLDLILLPLLLPLLLLSGAAFAQPAAPASAEAKVPDRQIPPAVVAGLRILEHQFAQALSQDCAPERCFAKGCVYVSHTVVDQPAVGSLPGLNLDPGPGSKGEQIYLTSAECSFAHEKSVRSRDARALSTRLRAKLSRGWTTVNVRSEVLKTIPASLRESPEPPDPAPQSAPTAAPVTDAAPPSAAPAAPATWDGSVALREFWEGLLPHFAWMIGVLLVTLATLFIIWAVRRLGRQSPEEQVLLAQMLAEAEQAPAEGAEDDAPTPEETPEAVISARYAAWRERLADAPEDDPVLRALVADLLRSGDRRLLAKAVMLFPEAFPKAFPQGGAYASAKYELAEFIKQADTSRLPPDGDFFDALDRYALASALTAHPDTELIRTLHDEFGATALVDLMGTLPSRYGALLFALAPAAMQHEALGLLNQRQLHDTIGQLLRSNRMDSVETEYLLGVLGALRNGEALPTPPSGPVSDRGAAFDAAGALSILLPRLDPGARAALINATTARHNGRLPSWINGTLYGAMLLHLSAETRADLLLEVDVPALAAWLAQQPDAVRSRLLDEAPVALQQAVIATPPPTAESEQFALADAARATLSEGLHGALHRDGVRFEALLG